MEDDPLAFGQEFSALSDSTESIDSNDAEDVFSTFTGAEFGDLFDSCPLLEIRSETFGTSDCLFGGSDRKNLGSNNQVKPYPSNTGSCNISLKKDVGCLAERLHWNYGRARVTYDPRPISKRSRKRSIPEEQKDDAYWKKRCQNTERARKSREARRLKEIEVLQKVQRLEQEKLELQQEVDKLKKQLALINER